MIGQGLDASGLDAVLDVGQFADHRLTTLYELLEHPSIVRRNLDLTTGLAVAAALDSARVFDVGAGHAVVLARAGWSVITNNPGQLRRIDPDVGVLLV